MKKITISIDGYAGTGKSSTAKEVAKQLGYLYIDSGAMYRAITYLLLEKEMPLSDEDAIKVLLTACSIEFYNNELLLNGAVMSENQLRSEVINNHVSKVSALKVVREKLVVEQRKLGALRGIVMDGRDIGSYVFPKAELKIFMTSDVTTRARRRQSELKNQGIDASLASVVENFHQRDQEDSSRKHNPLVIPESAIKIDTTNLTLNQQIQTIVDLAKKIIDES